MMEAVHTTEMSVFFNETVWCYISEGCHLDTCCHENVTSHVFNFILKQIK
jgi:hypothetical protein